MMAEDAKGPYKLVDGDPLLLGNRTLPPTFAYIPAYCTRTFEYDGQVMVSHHWMKRSNLDGRMATVKILEEAAPGKLVLKYWRG